MAAAPIRTKRERLELEGGSYARTYAASSANPALLRTRAFLASAAEYQERVKSNYQLPTDKRQDDLAALTAIRTLLERLDASIVEHENPPPTVAKMTSLRNLDKARRDVLAAARECVERVSTCQNLFEEIEAYLQLRPKEPVSPRPLDIKWHDDPQREPKQRRDHAFKRSARPGDSLMASIVGLSAIAEAARAEEDRDSATAEEASAAAGIAGEPQEGQQQQASNPVPQLGHLRLSVPVPPAAPSAREAALLAARDAGREAHEGGDDTRRSMSQDVPQSSAATMCNLDSCASGHRQPWGAADYASDASSEEEEEDEVSSEEPAVASATTAAQGALPQVVLSQLPPGVQGPRALMAPQQQDPASQSLAAAAAPPLAGVAMPQGMPVFGATAPRAYTHGGIFPGAAAPAPDATRTGGGASLRSQEDAASSRSYVAMDRRRRPGITQSAAVLQTRKAPDSKASVAPGAAAPAPPMQTGPVWGVVAPVPAAAHDAPVVSPAASAMPPPRYMPVRAAPPPAAAAPAPTPAPAPPVVPSLHLPAQPLGQLYAQLPHPDSATAAAAAAATAMHTPHVLLSSRQQTPDATSNSGAAAATLYAFHPTTGTVAYAPVYQVAPGAASHRDHSLAAAAGMALVPVQAPGRAGAMMVASGHDARTAGALALASQQHSQHSLELWEGASLAETDPLPGPSGRRGRRNGRRRGIGLFGLVRNVVGFVGVSMLSGAAMVLGAAVVNTSLDEQEGGRRGRGNARRGQVGRGSEELIPQRTLQQLRGQDLLALGRG